MNTPGSFERRLGDWLKDGPTDAPSEILTSVMAAIPSRPQRRAGVAVPWLTVSGSSALRGLAGLAAVAVVAVGAVVLVPRLVPGNTGGPTSAIITTPSPSPVPSVSPSSSPSPSPVPTAGGASPSPSSAPPASPSPSQPGVAGSCAAADLTALLQDWQGAAGTRFGTIRVQNTGTTSCLIAGTPGIQLVDGDGRVFLDSAALGSPASALPETPVLTLRPGGTDSAYIMVGLTNYCGAEPLPRVRVALVLPQALGRLEASALAGAVVSMAPCNGPTSGTVLQARAPWSATAP